MQQPSDTPAYDRLTQLPDNLPPKVMEIDPKNALLWRQNRLRVDGEVVRDLYLAASGLLSAKIGGPSVFPPIPEGIDALSYAGNFKWTTSKGEDRYRRGMYTFFKRTAPHPDLTTFDCPDANTTNVKRTVSNTPLQYMVDYSPRRSRLVFQVDVFQAHGFAPANLDQVNEREKDIRYSSRTRIVTEALWRVTVWGVQDKTQKAKRLLAGKKSTDHGGW